MSSQDNTSAGRIIAVLKTKDQGPPPPDPEPVTLLPLEPLTAVCNTMVMISLIENPEFQVPDIQARTVRYEQTQGVAVTVMVDPTDILKAAFEIPPGADVNTPFIFNIIFDEGEPWSITYVLTVNNTPTEYMPVLDLPLSSSTAYTIDPVVIQSFSETNGQKIYLPNDFSLIWDIDKPGLERIEIQRLVVTPVGSVWGPDNIYNSTTDGFHKLEPGEKYRVLSFWRVNESLVQVNEGVYTSYRYTEERNLSLSRSYNDFLKVPTTFSSATSTVTRFGTIRKTVQDIIPTLADNLSTIDPATIVKYTTITETVQTQVKNAESPINSSKAVTVTRFNGINIGS